MDMQVTSRSLPKKHMLLLIGLWAHRSLCLSFPMNHFRPKLSKALITDPGKLEWRTAADLKIRYGTTLRLGVVCWSAFFAVEEV